MVSIVASTNELQKMEASLHAFLFNGYKKDVHPGVSNKSKASPVTVTFDAQVIRIIEVVCKNISKKLHLVSHYNSELPPFLKGKLAFASFFITDGFYH